MIFSRDVKFSLFLNLQTLHCFAWWKRNIFIIYLVLLPWCTGFGYILYTIANICVWCWRKNIVTIVEQCRNWKRLRSTAWLQLLTSATASNTSLTVWRSKSRNLVKYGINMCKSCGVILNVINFMFHCISRILVSNHCFSHCLLVCHQPVHLMALDSVWHVSSCVF